MNSVTRHDVLNNITGLLGLVDMLNETTADRLCTAAISEDPRPDHQDKRPDYLYEGLPERGREGPPVAEPQPGHHEGGIDNRAGYYN